MTSPATPTPEAEFITLRFDRSLYAGTAVDQAVKVSVRHGEFHLDAQPEAWVVRLRALRPALTRRLGHELANYALGLTIQDGGVQ